jgi:hypothetical protein
MYCRLRARLVFHKARPNSARWPRHWHAVRAWKRTPVPPKTVSSEATQRRLHPGKCAELTDASTPRTRGGRYLEINARYPLLTGSQIQDSPWLHPGHADIARFIHDKSSFVLRSLTEDRD